MYNDDMDLFQELRSLNHHAYLLVEDGKKADMVKGRERGTIIDRLRSVLDRVHGIKTVANPDFIYRSYETLTIDDARELKSAHEIKSISTEARKIFVVSMGGVTVEAENALLKLLEEPAPRVHFFLIVPSAHILLPTVRSRLMPIGREKNARYSSSDEAANKFIKSFPAKRIEILKKLIDDIAKDKKTKQEAVDFLDGIEVALHNGKGTRENRSMLEAVCLVRKYVSDRSPSLKMLLEYLALVG